MSIDGNDLREVRKAVGEAVFRARSGDGPSLVECMTYRWHGHNEGEEAFAGDYRPAEEIALWKDRDPIKLMSGEMQKNGLVTAIEIENLWIVEKEFIESAYEYAQKSEQAPAEEALTDVYADSNSGGQ